MSERSSTSRRGNLHKTCDPCRKRKIKCSSHKPCERCVRLGLDCCYSPVQPMGRPPVRRRSKQQHSPSMHTTLSDSSPSTVNVNGHTNGVNQLSASVAECGPSLRLDDPLAPSLYATTANGVPQELAGMHWGDLRDFGNIFDQLPPLSPITAIASDDMCQPSASSGQRDGGSGGAESYPGHPTGAPSDSCQCGRLVQAHLGSRSGQTDTPKEAAQFIGSLRESMNLTQHVLACQVCCNMRGRLRDVSGNVMLLGALMMMMARSCLSFLPDQRRRAEEFGHDRYPASTILRGQGQGSGTLEFSLDRRQFWLVLNGLMAAELDSMDTICDAMTSRQNSLHEHGHEECRPGSPCRKNQDQAVLDPSEFCPRSIDARSFFSCFRTIDHVRSVIREARQQLVTT